MNMNKVLKTVLIVVSALALSGGALYTGWALAGQRTQAAISRPAGMMNGWGANRSGDGQSTRPGLKPGTGTRRGPGGMMNGGGYGGMMQGNGRAAATTPLSVDQAIQAAQKYIDSLNLPDLKFAEVMIFDNGAYVRVVEQSSGIGAFELLVDPVTRAVYPEHGPNMMWNLKYGGPNHSRMMGGYDGMMGRYSGSNIPADVSSEMTVSADQALQDAQAYLDSALPATKVAEDADPFYGYYTIDVLRDGKIIGMLSVNGFTGQVFYHTWHGKFIELSEGK
jgi:hypothetical protein